MQAHRDEFAFARTFQPCYTKILAWVVTIPFKDGPMQSLTKLVCPHCHAILKSNKPLRPGKQVSCLKCRAPFSVSPSDLVAVGSVQEILVSASLADDADQVELAFDIADDVGQDSNPAVPEMARLESYPTPPERIPVGVLERPVPVSNKGLAPAPYFPPPVAKSAVPIAAPFSPPPAKNHGTVVAAFAGLLVILGCGAFLAWYCLQRNADGEEPIAYNSNTPVLEVVKNPKPNPDQQEPIHEPKAKTPQIDPKTKPASFEEPSKPEPEPKKTIIKKRLKPPPPLEMISFNLPEAEQAKVNEAIKRGVAFLKSQQLPSGTWSPGHHSVGYAALPGLTLLECQVPAADLAVQKAAYHVRTQSLSLTDTYDLSLAILFLDRLGERKDRLLIQQLALRLVAGQKPSGGWDYLCPLLSDPEMNQLMLFLHQTRPKTATLLYPLPKDSRNKLTDPLQKPGSDPLPNLVPKDKAQEKPGKGKDTKLIPGDNSNPDSPADPPKKTGTKPKVLPKGSPPTFVPPNLKNPPAFAKQGKRLSFSARTDNSNTQFALLALWAARRHAVPTENTLTLAQKRFQATQNSEGGWGYVPQFGSTDAMTGVGLLGLAMGHGVSERGMLAAVDARANKNTKANLQDLEIQKGLQAFGKYIGTPDPDNKHPGMVNCYYLWTLERVGMIYNLQTIGNKDWYRWGVYILLPNQAKDGSWFGGHYPGASPNLDTCFALLFLKRSNLVRDLTENLDLLLAITDPDAAKPKKR
jgi:hypothetical protein